MPNHDKKKVIVIIGTTASGKTKLGVRLAAKYNGEIISADSRQVYRGLDVGTGKDLQDYRLEFPISNTQFPKDTNINANFINIPYHMIDIASPNERYSLAEYQKKALRAIDDILSRGKLPIIVGGSGLYAQAIVDGYILTEDKPDLTKRQELDKKTVTELYDILFNISKNFALKLNTSDQKNKRRLIRYIELQADGKTVDLKKSTPAYDFLVIGINIEKEALSERIYQRLIDRLEKEDMVNEVERLHKEGLSWERLEEFGLEYKYLSRYLQEKIEYDEMVEKLFQEIKKFAKRQMTWYRRWERMGRKINWIENTEQAQKLIDKF